MEIVRDEAEQEPAKLELPDLATTPNYFVMVLGEDNMFQIHSHGDGLHLAIGFAEAVARDGDTNAFFNATLQHLQAMGRQAAMEAAQAVKPKAEA